MKTCNFHIEFLKEGSILVIPTSYLRPEFYIDQIEELLSREKSTEAYIYFDFLIKNGTTDRFYKTYYSNKKIELTSFTKVNDNPELLYKANTFFAENFSLIANSFLSKSQKFLLKKSLSLNKL